MGNLRAAPLFLRPSVVRALLSDTHAIAKGIELIAQEPTKLVNVPRRSEDPRLAKANDDCLSGAETYNAAEHVPTVIGLDLATGPDVTVIATFEGGQVIAVEELASEPGSGRAPAAVEAPRRGIPVPVETDNGASYAKAALEKPLRNVARRKDVEHRQRGDRDARALEASVDTVVASSRREAIAAIARRVAARQPANPPRLSLGAPVAADRPRAVECGWLEQRHERTQRAIAYLNARAIFVQVADRDSMVRKYRVSGKRDPQFAEDVFEIAVANGMPREVVR